VRITAPPDVAGLDELVAQWARQHPLVRLELSITSRTVDLVAEGFDLAIRAARLGDSSLIARRVGNAVLAIMASPTYLRRRGTPKSLDDLREHDWVLYRANDGHSTLTLTHTDNSEHAIDVVGTVVIDDMTLCRRAVQAGAGLGLLPVHTTADALRDGLLHVVLPEYQNGAASISVLMASAKNVPARVALVRDFLVDGLAKHMAASTAACAAQPARRKRG
jgi:DNA-binding transcriptional LysR family regulator